MAYVLPSTRLPPSRLILTAYNLVYMAASAIACVVHPGDIGDNGPQELRFNSPDINWGVGVSYLDEGSPDFIA